MPNFISSNELFDRILDIIRADEEAPKNKMLHETLVLTCSQGLAGNNLAFGNLFSQVDFLCKKHHVATNDAIAIQRMRRNSNHTQAYYRKIHHYISLIFRDYHNVKNPNEKYLQDIKNSFINSSSLSALLSAISV